MPNDWLRELAKINDIKLWQIAEKIGISDTTFSKMLRKELSSDKKNLIINTINEIITDREF